MKNFIIVFLFCLSLAITGCQSSVNHSNPSTNIHNSTVHYVENDTKVYELDAELLCGSVTPISAPDGQCIADAESIDQLTLLNIVIASDGSSSVEKESLISGALVDNKLAEYGISFSEYISTYCDEQARCLYKGNGYYGTVAYAEVSSFESLNNKLSFSNEKSFNLNNYYNFKQLEFDGQSIYKVTVHTAGDAGFITSFTFPNAVMYVDSYRDDAYVIDGSTITIFYSDSVALIVGC